VFCGTSSEVHNLFRGNPQLFPRKSTTCSVEVHNLFCGSPQLVPSTTWLWTVASCGVEGPTPPGPHNPKALEASQVRRQAAPAQPCTSRGHGREGPSLTLALLRVMCCVLCAGTTRVGHHAAWRLLLSPCSRRCVLGNCIAHPWTGRLHRSRPPCHSRLPARVAEAGTGGGVGAVRASALLFCCRSSTCSSLRLHVTSARLDRVSRIEGPVTGEQSRPRSSPPSPMNITFERPSTAG
jgi:hypothetical protein